MRVISRKTLVAFSELHPDALASLEEWHAKIRGVTWFSSVDVLRTFPKSSDKVGDCHVFNVSHNKYRLIAVVHYAGIGRSGRPTEGRVFVRHILTHKEYDRGTWKKECGC